MYKQLSNKEFVKTLDKAIDGDIEAIYKIIEIYKPVINKNSKFNGKYNQDCNEYIQYKIIENIKKFKFIKRNWEKC